MDKQTAKEAFVKGYEIGYGVEELSRMDYKVTDQKFEDWWSKNVEE